jgi:glycerol-3-phosphate cytidylyltransferase
MMINEGHGYSILGKPKQGFTCSAFDLLHAGHILMLEEARSQCDYLIVGLQNDPSVDRAIKNKPIQSLVERYLQLKAVKYVDEIIVYNTEKDLEDLLLILPIKIRFVGEEYKDKDLTGRETCNKRSIEIYYNKREHTFSTTELRVRVARMESQKTSYTLNVEPNRVGTIKWTEP